MTSPYPGEVSFPDGTIIIVDPMRQCGAGDFVIAKDVSTQRATFKKLTTDGGRWFLKPLNPSYPTIEIDHPSLRTVGRVIEWRRGGKL
jgi:SOS-response transcriptional repressor LexA